MNNSNQITLIIPTLNRSEHLKRVLIYYSKLEFKDLFESSTELLHSSLRNKKCFVDDNVCIHYDEQGTHETPKSEVYEDALYYALTLGTSFWVIHQSVMEYHFL